MKVRAKTFIFWLLATSLDCFKAQLLQDIMNTLSDVKCIEIIANDIQDEDLILEAEKPIKFNSKEEFSIFQSGHCLIILKDLSHNTLESILSTASQRDLTFNIWVITSSIDVIPTYLKGRKLALSVVIFSIRHSKNGYQFYQVKGTATHKIEIEVILQIQKCIAVFMIRSLSCQFATLLSSFYRS